MITYGLIGTDALENYILLLPNGVQRELLQIIMIL